MIDLDIHSLRAAYRDGAVTPRQVVDEIRARCDRYAEHNIWISRLDAEDLRPYLEQLDALDPDQHPLWGIPFAIKDNIDLEGLDTTAACEAFRYRPRRSATVVQRLLDAGAIPLGKTNLDQFATGLVGTRSPWGVCRNAFDPDYISGGSSSGSAVAVALGLASFALGTDTAGSGRVPAAFNNLVGLKPSRGLLSSAGMVPACRSLDCMSVFALSADDAAAVLAVAEGEDPGDPFSRANPYRNGPRQFGCREGPLVLGVIPDGQLQFFGDAGYTDAYRRTLARLAEWVDEIRPIDFGPFVEAARLLYEGPWVAERTLATRPLIDESPEALMEPTRSIIAAGKGPRATELFAAEYRLQDLKREAQAVLDDCTCLLTPTAGRHYRVDEIAADPVGHNSRLGYYTNFMNLLDLAAVAVPGCFTPHGMPFGVTLVGKAFSDRRLLSVAAGIQRLLDQPLGATGQALPRVELPPVADRDEIALVVCGAHMGGLPLNWQLVERGGRLLRRARTAPCYRLYALAGGPPQRPGLVRDDAGGAAVEAEIWTLPASEFGGFVAAIPAPLGIGRVLMDDDKEYSGFICEPRGVEGAVEITPLGGWRAWLEREG